MIKEKIIPNSKNHSLDEVQKVLVAFGNQTYDRTFLAVDMLDKLLPKRSTDANQQRIWDGMQSVINEMQVARRFNSTYIGHMLSEASIPALVADSLAREVGSNTVAREVSMVESRLELQTMRSLMDIVGYNSQESSGTFCTGGTIANLTALTVARKEMETKYEGEGKSFPDEVWVLTTDMAHYSIPKAVDLLGGPRHIIKIKKLKTDGMKMSTVDLQEKIDEAEAGGIPIMAVIGIMGETETGLVDDAVKINKIAHDKGIFTIGDGAYGAPYRLSRNGDKFADLNQFDAVVVDVHKCLYTPYGGGVVMFKNSLQHAGLARGVMANYIGNAAAKDLETFEKERPEIAKEFREGTGRLGAKRLEGSMSAAAILSTKAVLDTMGREGLATIYDLTLDRIEHMHQRLLESEIFIPCHIPELNLQCFTLKDEVLKKLGLNKYSEEFHNFITKTRLILDNNIEGEGGYYFSETDLPDESQNNPDKKIWTWRTCIMNPWTTDEIVDAAIDNLELLIKKELESKTAILTI